MGFFQWLKKKRAGRNGDAFHMLREGLLAEESKDSRTIQNNIIKYCEEMIGANKELEEEKSEYRIVTNYLKDIQLLEELPPNDKAEICGVAEGICKLSRKREEYRKADRKISDAQFAQMQQEESRMPDAIVRLQKNEDYQSAVKKDMNYLEGEKTEWHYYRLELIHQQRLLKYLSFALFLVFATSVAVLFVLQGQFRKDTTYAWMISLLIASVGGFCIYMKMSFNQTAIKQSEANRNRAVELLNKMKFKYVNVTNAVDYAREKYHVKNAYELNYIWEQYLNEVREREQIKKTSEELQYMNDKLVRLLKRYRLYDAQVWISQPNALADKKEMVEVKHNLHARRQKLRTRIEYNTKNIRERREEIDKILVQQNMNTPEVQEIISSIDQLDLG